MEENIGEDIKQDAQIDINLETCSEAQNGGVAKPLLTPKRGRGRPAASYIYEIPGKGKVPIQEYKKWLRTKDRKLCSECGRYMPIEQVK
jgi:hypothetical protein